MIDHVQIIATGAALPKMVVTNDDLAKKIDTSDAWIRSRTGIRQRHMVGDDENTLTLAMAALEDAVASGGLDLSTIDGVIVATMTPMQMMPSTACLLQQQLDMSPGIALDVNAACSGFVYAFSMANAWIASGQATTLAVIGVDTMTKVVNWQDRQTCVLFGDGAGAVVLQQSQNPGVMSTHVSADGRHANLLAVPGGLYQPLDPCGFLTMEGREVFKHAVKTLESMVASSLQQAGLRRDEIDWLVPHQANLRIIQSTAKMLKLPMSKVVQTIDRHANTSAASIPLALDHALKTNQIKPGDVALLEAFGAGFTWGSAIVKFNEETA